MLKLGHSLPFQCLSFKSERHPSWYSSSGGKGTKGHQLREAIRGQNELLIQQLMVGGDALLANDSDTFGNTALMIAADTAQEQIVEELLKLGANIQAKDNLGQTALMYASFNAHYHVVKMLIEHKAGVNVQTGDGQTSLMKACYTRLPTTPMVVALLVNQGKARLDLQRKDGRTSLMIAAESNSHDVVLFLLIRGAKIDAVSQSGETAAHIAASNGNFTMLQGLVRQGADISIRNSNGQTVEQIGAPGAASRFRSSVEAAMDVEVARRRVQEAIALGRREQEQDKEEGRKLEMDEAAFAAGTLADKRRKQEEAERERVKQEQEEEAREQRRQQQRAREQERESVHAGEQKSEENTSSPISGGKESARKSIAASGGKAGAKRKKKKSPKSKKSESFDEEKTPERTKSRLPKQVGFGTAFDDVI